MVRWSVLVGLVLTLGGCPPQSPQHVVSAVCSQKHAPAQTSDPTHAGDVCDRFALDDAMLPPQLAAAGCSSLASYQLGLGYKPFRYAICPVTELPPCTCNSPHVCSSPLAAFLACYHDDDIGTGRPYGWARILTDVCDACLGSGPPAGKKVVAWHQGDVCGDDATKHEQAIKTAVPNATDPPVSSGGRCDAQSCPGGCMISGAPNGEPP